MNEHPHSGVRHHTEVELDPSVTARVVETPKLDQEGLERAYAAFEEFPPLDEVARAIRAYLSVVDTPASLTGEEVAWVQETLFGIAFDWGSNDAKMHDAVDPKLRAALASSGEEGNG